MSEQNTTSDPSTSSTTSESSSSSTSSSTTTSTVVKREVTLPKGTKDYSPEEVNSRSKIFGIIENVFKVHGSGAIDTPVFELKETLTGKYGEDSKLIYDLEDQGGQLLSLRYDLTVPFARYVAMNKLNKFKRYHIGKVYRRDQPNMNRGRFREFYQCDCDIAGDYGSLIPDAECLQMMTEILQGVNLGNFIIRTSHRGVLDGMFEVCGVPEDKIRTISSAVDKLDKETWDNVKKEMLEKGLSEKSADAIGKYVAIKGTASEVLSILRADKDLMSNARATLGINELSEIIGYTDIFDCTESISIDLSLARGLDYYTGIIYEAVITDAGVGTVSAGGRYDGLIGMFCDKPVPSVGFSVGVERLMAVMMEKGTTKSSLYDVLVIYEGDKDRDKEKESSKTALYLCSELWSLGIKTSMRYDAYKRRQLGKILAEADSNMVKAVCLVNSEGISFKNMETKEQTNSLSVGDAASKAYEMFIRPNTSN